MHVLVTGLQGFTGKYLETALLAHGHTVVGLQADLTDLAALSEEVAQAQPDAVIHLGGISFAHSQNINEIYHVNLLGARNLLVALAQYAPNIKHVTLASTGNVYGNSIESVLTEQSAVHPANDYAVSKLSMEYMAALWADKLPICIVRPFNYTGVGQAEHFLIPKIVAHFKAKAPVIELGNLDVSREFGDVRVVASLYARLLEKNVFGKTFNLCTGQSYSLREVIGLCETLTGHAIEVRVNPAFVRPNEVRNLVGSYARLEEAIGSWDTIALESTLQWMLSA